MTRSQAASSSSSKRTNGGPVTPALLNAELMRPKVSIAKPTA